MRIAIIYQGGFPPAERLEKVARTLIADGNDVYLLCNSYAKEYRREETVERLSVSRVGPVLPNETLSRIVKFPVFANPVWVLQIARFVRRHRIDAIHVVDLPLAAAAWAVARMFKIPVIMDMWENYPEALKGWAKESWKTLWFKNPAVARAVERWIMPRMDHTIVVVEEQRDRLVAEGIDPDRISVITNAIDPDSFAAPVLPNGTALDAEPGTYKLIYIGMITPERGLEDIVRAVGLLRSRMPFIRFYIAGTGEREPPLRKLVAEQGLDELVRFLGWLPFKEIHSYLEKSDLCVIPHVNNAFINTTIPNKLFQYMFMGKPVLVSDAKPLARIVRECSCGFVFQSGNPQSAASTIEMAYAARTDSSIGERGQRRVLDKYTWDKVSPALRRIYGNYSTTTAPLAQLQD